MNEFKKWLSERYIDVQKQHKNQGTSASYNKYATTWYIINQYAEITNDYNWPIIHEWALREGKLRSRNEKYFGFGSEDE